MDTTQNNLREREEYWEKACVDESINAMFDTLFSVAYAEISRIEDQHPWFDTEPNKGQLDFAYFYTVALRSLKHLMKGKSEEDKAAIGDLILNDLAETIGFSLGTESYPENTDV